MKVSITLPSMFPEACARAIKNIRETTRNDHEIVVVSSFDPGTEGGRVLWVPDTNEKKGAAVCQHKAALAATGDVIAAFADDFLFIDGWDELVVNDFFEREKLAPQGKPFVLGMRYNLCGFVGSTFGVYYANFPVMRREMVKKHGWISPDYRAGFGDGDLSMRVWDLGGRCEFSRDKVLIVTPDDNRKGGSLYTKKDMQLFVSRWAPRFGKGWKTDDIRDFNMEVCPEDHPELLDESKRTLFHNDPSFVAKVRADLPPYLIETIGQVNLVRYQHRVFLVPHSVGQVDLTRTDHRARSGIVLFESLENARSAAVRQVHRAPQPPPRPSAPVSQPPPPTPPPVPPTPRDVLNIMMTQVAEQPRLVSNIDKVNLVAYMGKVFAVPQSLGAVDLTNAASRCRAGIVVYESVSAARESVARRRGR